MPPPVPGRPSHALSQAFRDRVVCSREVSGAKRSNLCVIKKNPRHVDQIRGAPLFVPIQLDRHFYTQKLGFFQAKVIAHFI